MQQSHGLFAIAKLLVLVRCLMKDYNNRFVIIMKMPGVDKMCICDCVAAVA